MELVWWLCLRGTKRRELPLTLKAQLPPPSHERKGERGEERKTRGELPAFPFVQGSFSTFHIPNSFAPKPNPKDLQFWICCASQWEHAFLTSPPTSRCQGRYPGMEPGTRRAQWKYSGSIKQAETKLRKARMQMLQSYSALRKCHPPSGTGERGQAQKFPAPSEFTEKSVPTLVIRMCKNPTTQLPDGEVGANGCGGWLPFRQWGGCLRRCTLPQLPSLRKCEW